LTTFFLSVLWFVVALGTLVAVHEFGHFWMARRLGVKVLRFSIGFGRPIWQRTGRDGVVYQLALIPLGGYVKMLDDRDTTPSTEDAPRAFNRQPLGARAAIVAAGPLINLLLAMVLFWVMYLIGIQGARPIVDVPQSVAAETPLQAGDQLLSIDGDEVVTWQAARLALLRPALEREPVFVRAVNERGQEKQFELPLDRLPDAFNETRLLEEVGLTPQRPLMTAEITDVVAGSAAERAGLQVGDRVIGVNDKHVEAGGDWRRAIADGAGESVALLIERNGRERRVVVEPVLVEPGQPARLGIAWRPGSEQEIARLTERYMVTERFGPVVAAQRAFTESIRLSLLTVDMIGKMITRDASLDNLSGPISIATYARITAESGIERFLHFLGVISLSLFVINLLPVPVLDGGHLLYYLIEAVRGRPLSDAAQAMGQMVGMALMACLMVLVLFIDLKRLFGV
jgi:regulator of sigma E protease